MYTIEQLKDLYPDIPLDIWEMIKNMDAFTYNHSVRMCEIARFVEQELGLPDRDLSEAALLHDIGKYYISSRILDKKGNLTDLERRFIDGHAPFSYFTLKHFHIKHSVCQLALYHHTLKPKLFFFKFRPCKDVNIAKLAGILRTMDIYEAMSTDRPYHRGLSDESIKTEFDKIAHDGEALNIIMKSEQFGRR